MDDKDVDELVEKLITDEDMELHYISLRGSLKGSVLLEEVVTTKKDSRKDKNELHSLIFFRFGTHYFTLFYAVKDF